ncbi:MAG TPA: hypothetical protein VGS21_02165 [Acidimicrobiales bacterium]|nr:hypothetical protein [Acidimicrobiales bacterium]
MPAGETLHVQGHDGARRAKIWLEKTGRVEVHFSRYELEEAPFLTFPPLVGHPYSFDLGGVLRLPSGTASFFGEVKKVSSEAGQGTQYQEYLAKCYRATVQSAKPHHFMWITWHPFSVTTWAQLCTPEQVRAAVTSNKAAYCGEGPVDEETCSELAKRLWLIVLSDRQETLSMSDEMLGALKKAVVEGVAR